MWFMELLGAALGGSDERPVGLLVGSYPFRHGVPMDSEGDRSLRQMMTISRQGLLDVELLKFR